MSLWGGPARTLDFAQHWIHETTEAWRGGGNSPDVALAALGGF